MAEPVQGVITVQSPASHLHRPWLSVHTFPNLLSTVAQGLPCVQSYVKEHGKMGPAFGHAGMVLSATAILKDMDDHGVLDTLFHGEEYKDQQ